MKNLLYTAALGLLIVGCSKPTMYDTELLETPSPITNSEGTPTPAPAPTGEDSPNQNDQGDPNTTVPAGVIVPAGVTYVRSTDDGKGNIGDYFTIDETDGTQVIGVRVFNPEETTVDWIFGERSNEINVDRGINFELITYVSEIINFRGIEIIADVNAEINLYELDEALDLAGDNWVTDKIYVANQLETIGYFAGVARDREMIVSFGGFETHVLLHENGHNYDFTHENYSTLMDPLYHLVFDTGYYTSPIAEYRAEMFARYYLLINELPTQLVELMRSILG